MTTNRSILGAVLAWLRAGYPHGVPREDYVALFAVLHRKLTETEVEEVIAELVSADTDGVVERAEIESAIARLAHEKPGEEDVARVAARLAAGGWPLARPGDL
ncbi:DUF3349 domain-containing protein [Nocardia yamanashiensis]|uniref:DUF3349 domain-containing protein n=1 Tax=Nocardia yamanashiensis TaxID=209247 RepID=UPI001E330A03|nr:DUF3349 domain-containing protein [Nocardia yamanashiensis]UGT43884.1 DUF3349 domain-containing protein [Nocardia yamanashiensis]